jgi:hypothetical protein
MICRQCGTEIADKAIVCYRCGTGTAEPLRKPAEIRRRRSPLVPAIIIILVILAALAWFAGRYYHVFGLETMPPAEPVAPPYTVSSVYSVALIDFPPALIDFPTIDA